MAARRSRAGSKMKESLVSSIFHSTMEWLLSPGRSHSSRDTSWLTVKFSSCPSKAEHRCCVKSGFVLASFSSLPPVFYLGARVALQGRIAGNVHWCCQVRLHIRAGDAVKTCEYVYICACVWLKQIHNRIGTKKLLLPVHAADVRGWKERSRTFRHLQSNTFSFKSFLCLTVELGDWALRGRN